ncbi:hypothetical protein M0802_006137 [Mischocyttarus mexicanus]|nr:hypothetical protein M0802_006137 [Mischocyttarus mexicanus]
MSSNSSTTTITTTTTTTTTTKTSIITTTTNTTIPRWLILFLGLPRRSIISSSVLDKAYVIGGRRLVESAETAEVLSDLIR